VGTSVAECESEGVGGVTSDVEEVECWSVGVGVRVGASEGEGA
jgi:hypothetical protein